VEVKISCVSFLSEK